MAQPRKKKPSLAFLLNLALSELECSGYLTAERKAQLIAEGRAALFKKEI